MTLADEDTNLILTDNANRAIQSNEAMQVMQTVINALLQLLEVAPPGDQIYNQFKWCQVIFKTLYRPLK